MGNILSTSDIESMALAVQTQSFAKGEAIVREGEKGDVFYVITKGSVDVSQKGKTLASLGVNTFFGEKALLSSDTRNATCVAATNVECLILLRDDFVLLQEQYWDQDGILVKVMQTREISEMGGRSIARIMRMGKLETPQEWTEMTVSAIEFDLDLPASTFTLSSLRNPRQ